MNCEAVHVFVAVCLTIYLCLVCSESVIIIYRFSLLGAFETNNANSGFMGISRAICHFSIFWTCSISMTSLDGAYLDFVK